jgi:hypothetical protein
MAAIQEIMQVGVSMPDREAFANFVRDMLGLPATSSPEGNITYVRADRYQHRIAARTAPEPVLNYVGFDVGGSDGLAEWKTKLSASGIDWRRGSPDECAERHVTEFIEFKDPDGHALALSYGFKTDNEPVHYTRDKSFGTWPRAAHGRGHAAVP